VAPAPDPPGAWAHSVDGEIAAELVRSLEEGLVRAELEGDLWCIRLLPAGAELRMVYAGSIRAGLARAADSGHGAAG
jgi:hypothetical protein